MDARVVDASAVCAAIFLEPEALTIKPRISGVAIVAPGLLAYEVSNVLVTKRRSNGADDALLLEQFRDFLNSEIDYRSADLHAAVSLAKSLKLSVYDACYLALAQHLGLELVTLDKRLAAAATKIGVTT